MNGMSHLFVTNSEDQLKYNDISIIDKISIKNKQINSTNKYNAMNYINPESIKLFRCNENNSHEVNTVKLKVIDMKEELRKIQETNNNLDIEIEELSKQIYKVQKITRITNQF